MEGSVKLDWDKCPTVYRPLVEEMIACIDDWFATHCTLHVMGVSRAYYERYNADGTVFRGVYRLTGVTISLPRRLDDVIDDEEHVRLRRTFRAATVDYLAQLRGEWSENCVTVWRRTPRIEFGVDFETNKWGARLSSRQVFVRPGQEPVDTLGCVRTVEEDVS